MPRLNLQKAKQLGYSDEQIQTYLSGRPDVTPYEASASMPVQQPQEDALSRIADWLPVAGAVGGSFIPGAGTIVGGALGAGAGALAKQFIKKKPIDVGEIGKEAAFGGIGGIAGKIAAPVIRGAGRFASKMFGGAGEMIPQKAAQSVLNASPSSVRNAAEIGINLNKSFVKHSPYLGNSFDEMVGPIGKKIPSASRGGNISKRIKMFEDQINGVVSEAGSTTKISGNEIIKALRQELANEKLVIGNDARVNILGGLIKEAENVYKNGSTVGKALNKLRIANRQFGKSILEDQTGSMISSAQKLEANVLRNKLKTLFPTIGDALDNEQELIILREVLGNARAKTQAGTLGLAELDISKPGTLLRYFLGSPKTGGRIAQMGAKKAGQVGAEETVGAGVQGVAKFPTGKVTGQTIAQTGTRAVLDQPQEEQPTIEEEGGFPEEGSSIADFTGETGKQKKIKQAFLMAMMANPKQANTLKSIYDFGFPKAKEGAADEFINKANNNIDVLLEKSKKLGYGPAEGRLRDFQLDKLGGAGSPPEVVALNQRYNLLKLNILRAYQGARISDKDFELASRYIPSITDTDKTAKIKLETLRDILLNSTPPDQDILQGGTASETLQDFNSLE